MFTIQYFIEKFSKIPDELYELGSCGRNGKHCVAGHCGITDNNISTEYMNFPEVMALIGILEPLKRTFLINRYHSPVYDVLSAINDRHVKEYQQETPKLRILAALNDALKLPTCAPEVKTVIQYVKKEVTVDQTISQMEIVEN